VLGATHGIGRSCEVCNARFKILVDVQQVGICFPYTTFSNSSSAW
jgi:hypothetical protein